MTSQNTWEAARNALPLPSARLLNSALREALGVSFLNSIFPMNSGITITNLRRDLSFCPLRFWDCGRR
jgi:hypothetical protein